MKKAIGIADAHPDKILTTTTPDGFNVKIYPTPKRYKPTDDWHKKHHPNVVLVSYGLILDDNREIGNPDFAVMVPERFCF